MQGYPNVPPPVPPQYMPQPPRRPGWWSRNWKWVVPAGCLTMFVLVALFVFAIVAFVFGLLRSSEPYKEAVARANSNPVVVESVGKPIEEGFWVVGAVNYRNSGGEAKLVIPLSGPKGKATIFVEAERSAGQWIYNRLEAEIEGKQERIDLLE